MSGNATHEFDPLGADAVFGDAGARILRVIPIQDTNGVQHEYFDRRDVGWLMRCDQEQWLIVNFWAQVAIAALLLWSETYGFTWQPYFVDVRLPK
jgi:hypothetical protein